MTVIEPSRLRLSDFLRWAPAMFWMSSIFVASGDVMSHGGTSRYFYPFFRSLFPGIREETLHFLHFLFRKGGHVVEYALLAGLLWFAVGRLREGWGKIRLVWLSAVLYAACDEFRQSFVPSRGAAVADVGLDAVGAALGIALIILFPRLILLFRKKP